MKYHIVRIILLTAFSLFLLSSCGKAQKLSPTDSPISSGPSPEAEFIPQEKKSKLTLEEVRSLIPGIYLSPQFTERSIEKLKQVEEKVEESFHKLEGHPLMNLSKLILLPVEVKSGMSDEEVVNNFLSSLSSNAQQVSSFSDRLIINTFSKRLRNEASVHSKPLAQYFRIKLDAFKTERDLSWAFQLYSPLLSFDNEEFVQCFSEIWKKIKLQEDAPKEIFEAYEKLAFKSLLNKEEKQEITPEVLESMVVLGNFKSRSLIQTGEQVNIGDIQKTLNVVDLINSLFDQFVEERPSMSLKQWASLLEKRSTQLMYGLTEALNAPSVVKAFTNENELIFPAHLYTRIYFLKAFIANLPLEPLPTFLATKLESPDTLFSDGPVLLEENVRVSKSKQEKYLWLYYSIELHRLFNEIFSIKFGPILSKNELMGDIRAAVYEKQFEKLVEALNLVNNTSLTVKEIREKEVIPFHFETPEDRAEFECNTPFVNFECERNFLRPGIYKFSYHQRLFGKELIFSPLAMYMTDGNNITLEFDGKVVNPWIDSSFYGQHRPLLNATDKGSAPLSEIRDHSKPGNPNYLFVLYHPGWTPERNSSGQPGKNAGVMTLKVGELQLIPQLVGIGAQGQDGLPGHNSPLIKDGQYYEPLIWVGRGMDDKNSFGGVTIVNGKEVSIMLGRRNYNHDERGNPTTFHQNEAEQRYFRISRGEGGHGGNGGNAGSVILQTPNAEQYQIRFTNLIFTEGAPGSGAPAGRIGPSSDDINAMAGRDGVSGKPGEIKLVEKGE